MKEGRKEEDKLSRVKQEQQLWKLKTDDTKLYLKKKYDNTTVQKILKGDAVRGMTPEALIEMYGEPFSREHNTEVDKEILTYEVMHNKTFDTFPVEYKFKQGFLVDYQNTHKPIHILTEKSFAIKVFGGSPSDIENTVLKVIDFNTIKDEFEGAAVKCIKDKVRDYREYKDGMLNGLSIIYWNTGAKYREISYVDDKLDGEFIQRYWNGQVFYRLNYANDKILDDKVDYFNMDGGLIQTEYYTDGQLVRVESHNDG